MSATSAPVPFLRLGNTTAPRRRLFCLPFAGGGAAPFRPWARTLPPDVELMVAQLPGRESRLRDRPFDAIEEMASAVLPTIVALSEVPYAIFGHSMGALVAFELTLALEDAGVRPPSHLFVSSRRSPCEPDAEPPVHVLSGDAFLDELQRRYGAIPDVVRQEPELLELLLPVLRADIRAVERYASSGDRKVRCPVCVYGGADDRRPTPAQLAGWQDVAEREVRVRVFAGDHFYLNTQRDALTADIVASWANAVEPLEYA